MSNIGKNNLWKVVSKQPFIQQSNEQDNRNERENSTNLQIPHLISNKSSKNIRPPPLFINNNLSEKYSRPGPRDLPNYQSKGQQLDPNDVNDFMVFSNKLESQFKNSFQKNFEPDELKEPVSPWMNEHGDKISHIVKKSDQQDQLSFTIDKGIEISKPQTYSSMIQNHNPVAVQKNDRSQMQGPKTLTNIHEAHQNIYYTTSVPQITAHDHPEIYHAKQWLNPSQNMQQKRSKAQKWVDSRIQDRENQMTEQIHSLKQVIAFEKISHETKQKQYQTQIKQLKHKLQEKASSTYKLNLKLKNLSQKFREMHRLLAQQVKAIPSQLQNFRTNQCAKVHSQIYDKLIEYQYSLKQWNQQCLEGEYEKRKFVEKQLNESKKRTIEQQTAIHTHQQQKSKMQKLIRDLQFTAATVQCEKQELEVRMKRLSEERSSLNIELDTLAERNKSLKQHINHLSKNIYNKSSQEGQQEEDMTRKYNRTRKQLEEKNNQVKSIKILTQKLKQEQQSKLQALNFELRQVESTMAQYRQKFRHEIDSVHEQLKDEQQAHRQTQQILQTMELKLKQNELLHYKQVETYDQALREVEKDLEVLSLKKNLREEQLNQKELELNQKQNLIISEQDSIRQQQNQLECAIQLYRQNLLLLQKKEGLLASQYHETVQLQTQSKAAWYERYYKLYSPSHVSSNSQDKHFLATNKFNPSLSSVKSQQGQLHTDRTPFTGPPYVNDLKKIAIKERLDEIDNLRSRIKPQSPRHTRLDNDVLSRPQSPRAVNLIHKAKSTENQRSREKSPWKQRPQRDKNGKNNDLISLSIAKSHSPKPIRMQANKQFTIVKAKLDQIKTSISNEINASRKM